MPQQIKFTTAKCILPAKQDYHVKYKVSFFPYKFSFEEKYYCRTQFFQQE